jgi:hypothetical protein
VSGDDDLRSDDAARAADRALHARLLSGNDPTASSDLFLHYLEPVHAYLRRAFPQTDEADTFDVATDLLLALPKHPERYDPDRSSLLAYLKMAVYSRWRMSHFALDGGTGWCRLRATRPTHSRMRR